MKKKNARNVILFLIILLFFVSIFEKKLNAAAETEKLTIDIINEAAFYPNAVFSENIVNIPDFALVLQLFRNNFNLKNNDGYFGIDFSKPVIINGIMNNKDSYPDAVFKFKLASMEKLNSVIQYFTQFNYSISAISERPDFYRISSIENSNPEFYLLNKNGYCYFLIDIAAFTPDKLKKIIAVDIIDDTGNFKNTVDARSARAFLILSVMADREYSFFDKKINALDSRDKIFYFYNKSLLPMLEKLGENKIIEFAAELLPENLKSDNCIFVSVAENELNICNYFFDEKPKSESYMLPDINILKYIEKNNPAGFAFVLDADAVYKKKIIDMDINLPGLKYYILNFAALFSGELYAFFNFNAADTATNILIAEPEQFYQQIINIAVELKPVFIAGIKNKQKFIDLLDNLCAVFPDILNYSTAGEFSFKLILNFDKKKSEIYFNIDDTEKKFLIVGINLRQIEDISKQIAVNDIQQIQTIAADTLKKLTQQKGIPETFFIIDTAAAFERLLQSEILNDLQIAVFGYFAETVKKMYYYSAATDKKTYKNFNIEFTDDFEFSELYKIFKESAVK